MPEILSIKVNCRVKYLYSFFISMILFGCSLTHPGAQYRKLSLEEKKQVDTLLLSALDHEALYTLLDTIKPISSVKMVRYPIAPDNAHQLGTVSPIKNLLQVDSLDRYYLLSNKLSGSKVEFVMIPYKAADKENRNVQLYVVRKAILQKIIAEKADFFGQFGITKNTPAHGVISIIEHAHAYNRWRGYGYLFGYPDHAVDFFVRAGITQDSTGKFVERKFFSMPVFAGTKGYFTYALPENYMPNSIDSAIYQQVNTKLNKYKQDREKWVGKNKMKTRKILRKIERNK